MSQLHNSIMLTSVFSTIFLWL